MKVEIDLTGSDDVRDDINILHAGYAALQEISSADAQKHGMQLDKVSELLYILNSLGDALLKSGCSHVSLMATTNGNTALKSA